MNSVIFKLSKFVVVPVLVEWLVLPDLVCLDAACSSYDRQTLIAYYTEFSVMFAKFQPDVISLSLDVLAWQSFRGIDWILSISLSECFLKSVQSLVLDSAISKLYYWIMDPNGATKKTLLHSGLQHVKVIRIDVCSWSSTTALRGILKLCPSLEECWLGQVDDIGVIMEELAESCPRLQKLTCMSILDDNPLQLLVSKCSLLSELNCAELSQPRSIEYLQRCSNVRVLSISQSICNNSVFRSFPRPCRIEPSSLHSFVLYCGNSLTQLDLSNEQGYIDDVQFMIDSGFRYGQYHCIGQHCPNLTALFLPTSKYISADALMLIVSKLPQLTALGAELLYEESVVAIPKLAVYCPNITLLRLRFASMVGGLFPLLHSLLINGPMPNGTLEPILTECSRLTSLSLHVNFHWDFDPIIIAVNLQYLRITSPFYRGMAGLAELVPHLVQLRGVDIDIPLTGSVALSFLRECPSLTEMKFEAHDEHFQYHEFYTFAEMCGNLVALRLVTDNPVFDIAVIKEIVTWGRKLKRLCIVAHQLEVWSISILQTSLEKVNPRAVIRVELQEYS